MILAACHYCGEPLMKPIAPIPMLLVIDTCDKCGKSYWQLHSRVCPASYDIDEFNADELIKTAIRNDGAICYAAPDGIQL